MVSGSCALNRSIHEPEVGGASVFVPRPLAQEYAGVVGSRILCVCLSSRDKPSVLHEEHIRARAVH